jgi:hypothetical protein
MLMANSFAPSTTKQDHESNWGHWVAWCATHRADPVRPYFDKRATAWEAAREQYLWTAALPWIYARLKPGPGRKVAKPSSAMNVLRGVRRVMITLGYDPPSLVSLNLAFKGLMRQVLELHGPEVLETHRTNPIPFKWQCELLRLLRSPKQTRLGKLVTNGCACTLWKSLDALAATLGSTGMRKAEVTSKTQALAKTDLLRSNLTWIIEGVPVVDPSREQFESMTPRKSWAVLKPAPSKADPFGIVWGTLPIYLIFDPTREVNAATSLRNLELHLPKHGADRRALPLFCDNNQKPFTGSAMDALLKKMREAVGCPVQYSWHSYRAALACQLLEAHASTAEILSLCRWQSEESLHTYAQLSAAAYTRLLDGAYGRDFTQVRYSETPLAAEQLMMHELQNFNMTD